MGLGEGTVSVTSYAPAQSRHNRRAAGRRREGGALAAGSCAATRAPSATRGAAAPRRAVAAPAYQGARSERLRRENRPPWVGGLPRWRERWCSSLSAFFRFLLAASSPSRPGRRVHDGAAARGTRSNTVSDPHIGLPLCSTVSPSTPLRPVARHRTRRALRRPPHCR